MPIRFNLTDAPDEPNAQQAESTGPLGLTVGAALEEPPPALDEAKPPSSNGSGSLPAFRRNKYAGLDHTDLLHIIEEIEDNRSWVSLREKLWIALIIHMLVAWYLLYGPKYIYHVHVVDPSVIMKQRQKDLTFLDLPPDALRKVKPKPTPVISDKDRVAETPHPTLDRKTLEELEAMRRAAPPAPAPQPTQQPAAPAPA
ncbi:MAG: hypothetical protein WBD98_05435, partial [Acidobacteriaceae bacterium]